MAAEAKKLGIELFVLDDGWFGARNSDKAGLGDYTVNRKKLPEGSAGLNCGAGVCGTGRREGGLYEMGHEPPYRGGVVGYPERTGRILPPVYLRALQRAGADFSRSFYDSNGDGIGDLNGIIGKLDYLKNLRVDALWLSPVYDSPNDDNGYDIRDYQKIMDEFGTMEDMDRLLLEVHQRGIRLIMDLVVNHTSDEHRWFQEALSMIRWWLDKGVDGFRMDVVNYISKREGLPDGDETLGEVIGFTGMEHYFYGPRLHEYLQLIRKEAFDPRQDDYRYDLNYLKSYMLDWMEHYGPDCHMAVFWENHDNPRMISKVAPDPAVRFVLAKLLLLIQLTLKGTPFLYQGQEIGMVNQNFTSPAQMRDIESWNLYEKLSDSSSVLAFVCSLFAVRKENPLFGLGKFRATNTGRKNLFTYYRYDRGAVFYVECNLCRKPLYVGKRPENMQLVLSNYSDQKAAVSLKPYEANLYRVIR